MHDDQSEYGSKLRGRITNILLYILQAFMTQSHNLYLLICLMNLRKRDMPVLILGINIPVYNQEDGESFNPYQKMRVTIFQFRK